MKTTNKNSPKNHRPLKTRLASRFLQAMKKIKNNTTLSSPSMENKQKRYHAIRAAAYASMASVVGPNKAWSRAVLRKIKNRQLQRTLRMKERENNFLHAGNPKNDLRGLVPGGKALDFGRLLNETGHYIKCLRAQVEIIRKIVDYSSETGL